MEARIFNEEELNYKGDKVTNKERKRAGSEARCEGVRRVFVYELIRIQTTA